MDPRTRHTHRAVQNAVLALATVQAIEEITVTDLCGEAGISRATFYRHWDSPATVLTDILRADLIEQYRDFTAPSPDFTPEQLKGQHVDLIERFTEHLEQYKEVYRHSIHRSDSELRRMLYDHQRSSVREYIREHADRITFLREYSGIRREFRIEVMASNYAGGQLAIVEHWFTFPDLQLSELRKLMLQLAPAWNLMLMGMGTI